MPFESLVRKFHVAAWRLRGRKFYICHLAHENDRIAAETHADYLTWAGLRVRVQEFNEGGQRPELQQCLDDDPIAVVGYNCQLDHSWIGEENFIVAAGKKNIPVIQWILDHPSLRWPEFVHNPNAPNVRYLLVSNYCEQYFRRYALPGARTGVASSTFNPHSRVDDASRDSFLARDIGCLVPLNLRRVGGTEEELEARIESLDSDLRDVVREAIERARFDLSNPLVLHLEQALARKHLELPNPLMHVCCAILEDMTQIWRRRRIFAVAAQFPVLIQTDLPPPDLLPKAVARFRTGTEWTNPKATAARLKACRAVLSVSLAADAFHDRTGNAMNAGCVAIVEDNVVHRRLFTPGKNALFFRYDDDSLERCLDLVCNAPDRAYEIAHAARALRGRRLRRHSGWHNILDLAIS